MPFSGNTFTLPTGATNALPGQIVQSAVWDAIHSDIESGMTQLMSQLTTLMTGRNIVGDNGGMEVWQRGTPVAVAASSVLYTTDRWYLATGANQAYTVTEVTGLTNPSLFAASVQRTAAQTGVTNVVFAYPLETTELVYARGQNVTLTAILKAGANWSPLNGTLNYVLYCGTGAVTKRNATPYTNETTPISGSINVTAGGANTLLSATSSIVVPIGTTQMELQFNFTPVGTAGVADSISIDDVQLEVDYSSDTWTPTSFDRAPYESVYANCLHSYCKTFEYATSPAQNAGLIGAMCVTTGAAAQFGNWYDFPVTLNRVPSITSYNPNGASANWADITTAVSIVATINTTSVSGGTKSIYISGAAASAANHQILIHVTASAGI